MTFYKKNYNKQSVKLLSEICVNFKTCLFSLFFLRQWHFILGKVDVETLLREKWFKSSDSNPGFFYYKAVPLANKPRGSPIFDIIQE